jgi:hypothetical protein
MITIDKTTKETYVTDVAICNSFNLHSTITEKLHKYTNLKEKLKRIWDLKTAYIIHLVLSAMSIIPNKHHKFKTA